MLKNFNKFIEYQQQLIDRFDPNKPKIRICTTGCRTLGASEVRDRLKLEIEANGLGVDVIETGCLGLCSAAPVLIIEPKKILYQQVKPEDVPKIVSKTLIHNEVISRLIYKLNGRNFIFEHEIPFYAKQKKIVLRNCGKIDPKNINEYIVNGGYSAFIKTIRELTKEQVIEELKKSKLRGRGGAGFPTGLKWELLKNYNSKEKYIICNAEEGDPGSFMDKAIIEGDPHSIIEGMLIAGYVTGASQGYIYVSSVYPLVVENLNIAIKQATDLGLLGEDILGTGFNFKIDIFEDAGAYICGEETALISAIEGRRGMPSVRPPFTVEKGLWAAPTLVQNVETLANIAYIVLAGGENFAKLGTDKSGGTKVLSISGAVNNAGLVEVPMGTTLSEVIFDICGGLPSGRKLKAVQTGGPLGGFIPREHIELPIDYEPLLQVGAALGSGGMIIIDEGSCIVDLARHFAEFAQSESCGKCTPCRIGTKRMLEILSKLTEGDGEIEDIEKIIELSTVMREASLCGLGQMAPNPVLSTISFFYSEYERHIKQKHCPAKVCRKLKH